MMGGIISAPTMIGILNGCTAKPTINWKPDFFTEDQGILISRMAEIILPKTDTPGANDVGVPAFIESMVKSVYKPENRDLFMNGMKAFDEKASSEHGDPFIELDPEEQTAFLKSIHDVAVKEKEEEGSIENKFLMTVKELTVAGFFTSEIGATQLLQYDAVPGAYHGCLPVAHAGNGKTWAT